MGGRVIVMGASAGGVEALRAVVAGLPSDLPGAPVPRFRCRVGHAWSPASLEAEQAQAVDEALWAAVRALDEKADLVERLAADARRHRYPRSAEAFAQRAVRARAQAQQVRDLVEAGHEKLESGGGSAAGG